MKWVTEGGLGGQDPHFLFCSFSASWLGWQCHQPLLGLVTPPWRTVSPWTVRMNPSSSSTSHFLSALCHSCDKSSQYTEGIPTTVRWQLRDMRSYRSTWDLVLQFSSFFSAGQSRSFCSKWDTFPSLLENAAAAWAQGLHVGFSATTKESNFSFQILVPNVYVMPGAQVSGTYQLHPGKPDWVSPTW